ncbi:MAG: CDGSH iron-sulfur domain-containing protein [Bacteroidales bacterium]|nr:CDGSH iron-sulfur domain-containing protein [Bacteroidales bacterium]
MQDGPLVVKGNFSIKGSDGTILKTMKMASFCRCGQSKKMPFCDGTHRKIGFKGE